MALNPTETPGPREESNPKPKRRYQTPALVTFGRVAALTCNASCNATNDSTTTLACDPSINRAMNGSDRMLKQNIVRIASHPLGFGLYLFDYKPAFRATWGEGRQFGVMADEIEALMPEAVHLHPHGYRMVDYAMLGISRPPC